MNRLMVINYPHDAELAEKLKKALDSIGCSYVIFDDSFRYRVYIDKGKNTWNSVMHEVNGVHAVRFRYSADFYIKNGELYQEV